MLLRRFVPAEDSRAYSIDHWRGTQCCRKDLCPLKICVHIEEERNFAAKICVCKRFVCTLTRNAILRQRFVFAKDLCVIFNRSLKRNAILLQRFVPAEDLRAHWRGMQFCCKDLCLQKICVHIDEERNFVPTICVCKRFARIFIRSLKRNAILLQRFVFAKDLRVIFNRSLKRNAMLLWRFACHIQ